MPTYDLRLYSHPTPDLQDPRRSECQFGAAEDLAAIQFIKYRFADEIAASAYALLRDGRGRLVWEQGSAIHGPGALAGALKGDGGLGRPGSASDRAIASRARENRRRRRLTTPSRSEFSASAPASSSSPISSSRSGIVAVPSWRHERDRDGVDEKGRRADKVAAIRDGRHSVPALATLNLPHGAAAPLSTQPSVPAALFGRGGLVDHG